MHVEIRRGKRRSCRQICEFDYDKESVITAVMTCVTTIPLCGGKSRAVINGPS